MQEFFHKAEKNIIDLWKSTPLDATESRERLFLIHGLTVKFSQHFHAYLVNGEFAKRQLEEMIKENH